MSISNLLSHNHFDLHCNSITIDSDGHTESTDVKFGLSGGSYQGLLSVNNETEPVLMNNNLTDKSSDYAICQTSDGTTRINCSNTKEIGFHVNDFRVGYVKDSEMYTASGCVRKIADTTDASSSGTGSLQVSGGIGVAKKIHCDSACTFGSVKSNSFVRFGGNNNGGLVENSSNNPCLQYWGLGSSDTDYAISQNSSGNTFVNCSTGQSLDFQQNGSTKASMDGSTLSSTIPVHITDTTSSTSSSTGALIVNGGCGIAENLNAGAAVARSDGPVGRREGGRGRGWAGPRTAQLSRHSHSVCARDAICRGHGLSESTLTRACTLAACTCTCTCTCTVAGVTVWCQCSSVEGGA